ncbi:ATP-binding protein [Kitasatospora sp. NPDC048298]|uniref:ATP-binding protein n=1 Tax=Kitasatospora sp. NPDC048298 TaxID=3364049 RepID=UPI003713C42A
MSVGTDCPVPASAAVLQALERSRHLQSTVEEVLRLAKPDPAGTPPAMQPAADLLAALEDRWHGVLAGQGRLLSVTTAPGAGETALPGPTVAQILDILLDNARQHGRGAVDVILREVGGAIAVDVADEGHLALDARTAFDRGTTTGGGQGIGLALARDLAESAGGRLRVTATSPTVFTLLLPA